ncbi:MULTISPECIES: hypothetical protein [Nocardia]|uniref:hypothetical protein n=1 Tax=Nocardia TaxID=1817 RepID=UPI000FDC7AF6|nr:MULTISPECIES: hypothetical protein [Nocardia]MBF6185124.1 hypothetical protein [Nocardia farcinica]MBF6310960.1 hypothetical protein [Nocardia farcinica]MBF6409896.1 hypothetical protein [Nocardia farcinica]UEX21735.1 hypothetical protein LMJ57_22495 [Nocardia farcinica]
MRDIRSDHQAVRLVTSAALRAAVAWSQRETRAEAWRELSRMTGVVMQVFGPSDASFTPAMLIEALHHRFRLWWAPTARSATLCC